MGKNDLRIKKMQITNPENLLILKILIQTKKQGSTCTEYYLK